MFCGALQKLSAVSLLTFLIFSSCLAPGVGQREGSTENANLPPDVQEDVNPPSGGGGNETYPTFSSDILPLLKRSCWGSSCHGEGSSIPLDRYEVVTEGKGQAGGQCEGRPYVVKGKPEESLFYLKLLDQPPCGAKMPIGGSLPQSDIELVAEWIRSGALP